MVVSQSPYDIHEFIHSTQSSVHFVSQISWIRFRSEFAVHATWSAADVILGSSRCTAATFKKYQSVAIVTSARPLMTSNVEQLIDKLTISNVKLYITDNFIFSNYITINTYQSHVIICMTAHIYNDFDRLMIFYNLFLSKCDNKIISFTILIFEINIYLCIYFNF